MKPRFGCVLLGVLFAAQGCGAAQHALLPSTNPAPAYGDGVASTGLATVIITLPPIHKTGTPIDWSINSLSGATKSASVKIGALHFGPIGLNTSNPHCRNAPAGLTCTLVLTAKPGKYGQIFIETHNPIVKQALAGGNTRKSDTVSLKPGRNVIAIDVYGITRTLKVIPEAKTLYQGQYLLDQMTVEPFDAAHLLIPSRFSISPRGHNYEIGLRFSGFFNSTAYLFSSYYYREYVRGFPYDGLSLGKETVTAYGYYPYEYTPVSIPSTTITLTAVAGNSDFAPLMFGISVPLGGLTLPGAVQFPASSSSSSLPARQFVDTYYDPQSSSSSSRRVRWPMYGEDTSGGFWIGDVHFSNALSVVGKVTLPSNVPHASLRDYQGHLYGQGRLPYGNQKCALYEFPHRHGTLAAIREIDGIACGAMTATDSAGHVYVASLFALPESGSGYPSEYGVQEFPATGSGQLTPVWQFAAPSQDVTSILGMDVDDAGNVYLAVKTDSFFNSPPSQQIYKYAPGQATGSVQLGGLLVDGFAVDGAGDIYAVVPAPIAGSPDVTAVEEFAPGATTPMHAFGGTTAATYGSPILLPRFPR